MHRTPCQKTHTDIPRITHSSVTKSNLRLDVHTHPQSYTLASETSLNTHTNTHRIHTNAQRHTVHTITPLGQSAQRVPEVRPYIPTKNTTYKPLVLGKPTAHSHWHRLDLTLSPTRQKFKRYTDKRVRTLTRRQLRPKTQIHTTPLHNKSIQDTYSFTPLHSRHLPTYGTVVRRERTEQSDGAVPNLIHHHSTMVIEASRTSFTIRDEGHPTNHTQSIHPGRQGQATPCINRSHHTQTGKLDKFTKESHPIKPSFIDARKGHSWVCLSPRRFILASLAPNNLKQNRSWEDLMAHIHTDRKRLCKRWRYIINRRRHRLQCQKTYRKTHYESHTTLDFTTSKTTLVQILNQRVIVLTPNVITVEELVKVIGKHYDRAPRVFYAMSSGRILPDVVRLLPGQDVRIVPRLFGEGVGEKRKSGRTTRLDMTASLVSLRSLVADTLRTLVSRPDQPHCSMRSEGAQMIKVQLTTLHQKAQAEHHTLREDIRHLVATAETKPLQLLQDDLQRLHVTSTPCQGLHRMRPRLFYQPSCRHTEPWESCPNQIPQWIWSGTGDPTEETVGLTQDASAHFLRATRDVSTGTFLTVFGDTAIIRQKSKAGTEFAELFSATEASPSGERCQYTYRKSTGSDTYWISPHQDVKIISSKASKALKKALEFRSILKGADQAAQHSCCTQPSYSTSINAELGLIMRTSGNDDEDECLGTGLFTTRAIRTGEQIYVSYSEDVAKDWESTFVCRCYCCRCARTCIVQDTSDQAQACPTPMTIPISSDPMSGYQDLTVMEMRGPGLDGMEVDGLPLSPQEKTGYTTLGTVFSPNTERQYSNKRTKGLTEPDTSPTAPKERASILQYQDYVKETMQTLQQPGHDGIVDWMCQWWTTQVGGG